MISLHISIFLLLVRDIFYRILQAHDGSRTTAGDGLRSRRKPRQKPPHDKITETPEESEAETSMTGSRHRDASLPQNKGSRESPKRSEEILLNSAR